jgi:hypothetical protein
LGREIVTELKHSVIFGQNWLSGLVTHPVTGGGMRGDPTASQFPCKITVFEIHKHEKHFKVSHNKEFHKMEVLASFISV